MLAIRGANSAIAKELISIIGSSDMVRKIGRDKDVPLMADRFLFCQGLLRNKTAEQQSPDERAESYAVNCGDIIAQCDCITSVNDYARICVIGSESGFRWSYDGSYAAAKAALHRYVETKRLRTPDQQLICISPGIIGDAGMTLRRDDRDNLERRRTAHPKQRFLTSKEVAQLIHYALYVDQGYLSNIVIRMNGGDR